MTDDAALDKAPKSPDRAPDGKFLPGHSVKSPGRPPGTVDLLSVCRKRAREQGTTLEDVVWDVVQTLLFQALKLADVKAAKILLDRFCGAMEKAAGVQVSINNGTVNNGPPEPTTRDLGVYFDRLHELSGRLMTVELEPKPATVEELLS